MPQYLGHRGAVCHEDTSVYYQNTLEAFRFALLHTDGLETDATLSTDGEIYLIHSTRISQGKVVPDLPHHLENPTPKDNTWIESLSSKDINNLTLKGGYKIPKLEEVLQLFTHHPDKILNIELKSENVVTPVITLLKKYLHSKRLTPSQIILSSFDHDQLKIAKKELPSVKRGLLLTKTTQSIKIHPHSSKSAIYRTTKDLLTNKINLKATKPTYVITPTQAATKALCTFIKNHDLRLILWTESEKKHTDHEPHISLANQYDILDFIITDTPHKQLETPFDLAIIGAGINGAGIARDAALRHKRTIIFDQHDLGAATSANSTKLIHGGLRYLEFYEFNLVRKALKEREILLTIAPHISHPLRFNIPHYPHLRSSLLIKLGLFLYDHLYRSKLLPKSGKINLKTSKIGKPLKGHINKIFSYSDGWVDDHRLVISNLKDAEKLGASILPHSPVTHVYEKDNLWHLTFLQNGQKKEITAKAIVNATGPWAEKFLRKSTSSQHIKKLGLVKGSHIIIPQLYDHQEAYLLQQPDGRIVFTIPYENTFTLVGTTEEKFEKNPSLAKLSPDEESYLLSIIQKTFKKSFSHKDIIWSYSGVRPLIENTDTNMRKASRDYCIEKDDSFSLPFINIWGGKITTYRILAQEALHILYPQTKCSTHQYKLYGGDFCCAKSLRKQIQFQFPWLPEPIANRYARSYGNISFKLLNNAKDIKDLGIFFGGTLYEKEVTYLLSHEWVHSAEDILWRRTKQGLFLSSAQIKKLKDFINNAT